MNDVPDAVQHWVTKRSATVVLAVAKGETSTAAGACGYGLMVRFSLGEFAKAPLRALQRDTCGE